MSSFENITTARKKNQKGELWLMSYADLVTNLMAFFIMLVAMSKFDTSKFDAVASEMTRQRTDDLDKLKAKIDAEVDANGLHQIVKTDLGMDGLTVEFVNGVLFESSSAVLSAFALKEAQPILEVLKQSDPKYKLSFEGHTDDVPIRRGNFKDNWALSSARGVALLNIFSELGIAQERMSIAGYADTRPKIAITGKQGKELEEARALNRRAVIRVHQ